MNKFNSDHKGATTFPLIVLFGVILAWLMAFLFITLYNQQLDVRVDEQAEALADDLAKTAFTSLSGGQPIVELPRDVGGSAYTIEVQENNIFVIKISGGRRAGSSYSALVNATVTVENQDFSPGGRVYFMRSGDQIIVSAASIEAPVENIAPVPTGEPPEFYYFAQSNPREATAIGAAYFEARELYSAENDIDVSSYRWDGADLLAQIETNEGNLTVMQVVGIDTGGAGKVTTAWVVEQIEETTGETDQSCPSPENAYVNGWLYSPQGVLNHLRSRTWQSVSDNTVVVVPADASIQAAAATTTVSAYPTWRVTFEGYVIFYQMMPWWEQEDVAGFVFQSEPELEPVI